MINVGLTKLCYKLRLLVYIHHVVSELHVITCIVGAARYRA